MLYLVYTIFILFLHFSDKIGLTSVCIRHLVIAVAAAAKDENVSTETELINELLGPAANYDRRARPQLDAVNVSIQCFFESILELVNSTVQTFYCMLILLLF